MTTYQCNSCNKIEYRSIGNGWMIECSCGSGWLTTDDLNTTLNIELPKASFHNLKEYRKSKKYSQKLMADDLGISLRTYIDIEKGKRTPNNKTMLKLSKIYA